MAAVCLILPVQDQGNSLRLYALYQQVQYLRSREQEGVDRAHLLVGENVK